MTLTWVETGFPPQTTTSSARCMSRASLPRLVPVPAAQPASDSVTQNVEC